MSLTNDNTIAGNQQNDDTKMADALNGGESDEHENDVENDNASDSAKSALETDNEGWTSDSEVEDLDNDDFLGVEQGYGRSGKYIPSWPGLASLRRQVGPPERSNKRLLNDCYVEWRHGAFVRARHRAASFKTSMSSVARRWCR